MKILHFIYGLHIGGAESYIYNEVSNLFHRNLTFDFAIQDPNITHEGIKKYIKDNNSRLHILPKYTQPLRQYKELRKIIRKYKYDYIHVHMNAAMNPIPLILSLMYKNSPKFILHSHNSSNAWAGETGKLIHFFNSRILISGKSIKVACSELAGKWMFGKNSDYIQINNAIDANHFHYNNNDRISIRTELDIPLNSKVIGSIARFIEQKNHDFMIDCFSELCKTDNNIYLLLVGEGKLKSSIEKKVTNLGISNRVRFTGLRTDVPQLLSSMDCFFMPSLFEGLSFSAIEAQANGLRIISSDNITKMNNIQNYCHFISLSSPITKWCVAITDILNNKDTFDRNYNPVKDSEFDIPVMINQLGKIYQ